MLVSGWYEVYNFVVSEMDVPGTDYGAEVYGIPVVAVEAYGSDCPGCLAGDVWTTANVYQAGDVDLRRFDDEVWEEEELYTDGRPGVRH